ncbi:hypothetical protein, partial [Bergeriella denitrificans]|uniref:hypothetical protein n=1 Tax=Bergeriella denitrificans TaxID=494 RepID=UPI001C3FCAE7
MESSLVGWAARFAPPAASEAEIRPARPAAFERQSKSDPQVFLFSNGFGKSRPCLLWHILTRCEQKDAKKPSEKRGIRFSDGFV